jgi:hypothetical protein
LPAYPAIAVVPDATWPVVLPLDLIEEVVAAAGCRERRRRLLPAAAVMVFVLGLCLFSGEGYGEVARKLAGWLAPLGGPGWRVPGSSALARARRRVGPRAFELLFWRLASPLAGTGTPGAAAFGRLLMAIDGTTVDVAHTAANIAAFGRPAGGRFPQARLVTVTGCGTRGVAGAAFGARCGPGTSEQALARQIAGVPEAGMLVLGDRGFSGHPLVAALTARGADVLIRAKSSQWLPVIKALPDGSCLCVLPEPAAGRAHARARHRGRPQHALPAGITVRVIDAALTITPGGGQPRTGRYRLITTVLDPAQAPALALAGLYAQRWEAETGYRELKIFHRGAGRVLRSRDPAGTAQEIWALLCAHQLTQAARASAAHSASLDPDQISCTITLRAIRRAITSTTASASAIRAEALAGLLPPRRHRSYPRHTHAGTTRRRTARTTLTGTITTTITISTPAPGP